MKAEAEQVITGLWKHNKDRKPEVISCGSVKEAVSLAKKTTPEDGVILAFGSLSYLSELKDL